MKVTVVPAQVTTVEDRIMGNFSFSQMLLLVTPVFVSAALFAFLPPLMSGSIYKYVLMGFIVLLSCILAIRIKGKILAYWVVVLLRFNIRPKYYLYNKNSVLHRLDYTATLKESAETNTVQIATPEPVPKLKLHETIHVLSALDNPASRLRFEATKKGGLNVRLTEIQDQS